MAEACGLSGRPGPQLPAPDGRRGRFTGEGIGPHRRATCPPRPGPGPRPRSSSAPASPTPRTSPAGAGTATGTWSPSASPRRSGPPATRLARPPARPRRRRRPQRPLRLAPPVGGRGRRAGRPSLGVRGSVTLAATDELEVGGLTGPAGPAARLWPLDDLAARYQAFVDEHEKVPGYLEALRARREHLTDDAFMAGALTRDGRLPGDLQRRPAAARPSCSPAPGPAAPPATCSCAPAARPSSSAPPARGRPCSGSTTS